MTPRRSVAQPGCLALVLLGGVVLLVPFFLGNAMLVTLARASYPRPSPDSSSGRGSPRVVAFSAGVLGPLIGADLLHLREVEEPTTGMASVGGAGTFDGIVLSALVATLLA